MFDLIVLVLGALLAIRGWRKGLLRQLATLAPFALGLLIVVRLTPGWASVVEDWLGIPYGAALLLVGLALYAAVGIGGWAALHALARAARFPGLNTADRVAGAVFGVVWLVLAIMALTWFASFLPLPENVTTMLAESNAVARIAEPESLPRRVLDALTSNSWDEMLIKVEELSGSVDDLLRDLLGEQALPGQSPSSP